MATYRTALRRFADFTGRSGRTEFWTFGLINAAITAVLVVIATLTTPPEGGYSPMAPLLWVFYLVTLVPALAVAVRRLHDIGRTGWWLLLTLIPVVNLILLVFLVLPGDLGPNRFGYDPRLDTQGWVGHRSPRATTTSLS